MQTARILILILVLAVPAAAADADYVSVPHPTSFRGLQWGVGLADAPDLLPVQEQGFEDTFFRKEEPGTLGKAEIRSVAYYFNDSKLYRVGVAFKGRVNQFFLKEMLIEKYGPGRGIGFRYGWMWPDFSIELNYDDEHDSGSLYYTYEGKLE